MRYFIETSYPPQKWWEAAKNVFRPGWYGSAPYFKMTNLRTDGIGTQHVDLKCIPGIGDDSIIGNTIGHAHVPGEYIMITKKHYEELREKACGDHGRKLRV